MACLEALKNKNQKAKIFHCLCDGKIAYPLDEELEEILSKYADGERVIIQFNSPGVLPRPVRK